MNLKSLNLAQPFEASQPINHQRNDGKRQKISFQAFLCTPKKKKEIEIDDKGSCRKRERKEASSGSKQ
jgi:hypothetical protein